MATTRVYILAKELGVKSAAIVKKCRDENLDVKNHMSTISAGLAATIREWFSEGENITTIETSDKVDLNKVRIRRKKKKVKKKTPTRKAKTRKTEKEEPETEHADAATAIADIGETEQEQGVAAISIEEQPYTEEQKGKEKQYSIEFGFRKVQLPHRCEPLYLVVVKGFGEEPLMLLTTVSMCKRRGLLWWAVEAYLTRWRIEETIRYIKQCYDPSGTVTIRFHGTAQGV